MADTGGGSHESSGKSPPEELRTLRNVRPSDGRGHCPACDFPDHNGQCELRTITASQFGSLLALVCGLTLYFCEARASATGADKQFFVPFMVVFSSTAVYYLLAEWVIEETSFQQLRTLRRHAIFNLMRIEFWIRALVGPVLAFALALPVGVITQLGFRNRVDWGLVSIVITYELMLIWDAVVAAGGQYEIAAKYFGLDFGCGLITAATLALHSRYSNYAFALSFVVVALIAHHLLSDDVFDQLQRPFKGRCHQR